MNRLTGADEASLNQPRERIMNTLETINGHELGHSDRLPAVWSLNNDPRDTVDVKCAGGWVRTFESYRKAADYASRCACMKGATR